MRLSEANIITNNRKALDEVSVAMLLLFKILIDPMPRTLTWCVCELIRREFLALFIRSH